MIKCKECGCNLTDEIKFDLGWHCMYPCDHVTYFTDDIVTQLLLEPINKVMKIISPKG